MKNTRLFENPHHAYCDVYVCQNRATYFVGRPDGTLAATYKLCDECVEAMLTNLEPKHLDMVMQSSGTNEAKEPEQEPVYGPQPYQANEVGDEKFLPLNEHAPTEHQEQDNDNLQGHQMEEYQMQQSLNEKARNQVKKALESKTVDELKELAKEQSIHKYYDMKKDELVSALLQSQEDHAHEPRESDE